MIKKLKNIAKLISGVYLKSDITSDVFYLQAIHFNKFGEIDPRIKPQIQLSNKNERHLLAEGDVLFAAKGTHNFAIRYQEQFGRAVASSSFIVIRLDPEIKNVLQPDYLAWFLSNTPDIKAFHQQQLGSTIPSISIKKLSELEINIPPIEKQNLIIKIQKLRNRESKLLQHLQQKKEKQIQRLLINTIKIHK